MNRVYLYLMIVVAVSIFFYVVVPGYGARIVRRRWRHFRRRIIAASLEKSVRYGDLAHPGPDGFIGRFRFMGSLEAIQGSDSVWIHDGTMSVSAELEGVTVYMLPSASADDAEEYLERNAELLPDEMPQQVPWSRISTLTEGTRLIVSGALYSERGHAVFRSERGRRLTVLLFDGDERTLLRRSIWSGRQQNEYWNQFTLVSLLTGAVAQLVLVYYLSRMPMLRPAASLAFVGGIFPIVPFLPPGVGFFLLYRHLWRIGRVRRAERDLLSLPVRYFGDEARDASSAEVELPDGERYALRVASTLEEARALAPEARLRSVFIGSGEIEGYSLFGAPSTKGLVRPADPLAECLIVPGNPWILSQRCDLSARTYELASIASFAVGIGMNALILLALLARWIR